MEKQNTARARVIKHTGSHYLVSNLPDWNVTQCTVRGKLRLKGVRTTNPIAVGDFVDYDIQEDGSGIITRIHPRKNYIIRKSTNLSRESHIIAANIDLALIIVTLDLPQTPLAFIDRFLVTCEAYRIPVKIILNKSDLYKDSQESVKSFKELYTSAGYEVVEISCINGENIERLKEEFKDKLTLLSGISGVGKSTLINTLDSTLNLRTKEISEYHLQGKHTTTYYEIHPLKSGGFVIDTPGIRGFGLLEIKPEELSHYFPEMLKVLENCRFAPCTHTHEPGCAVKMAVETGEISADRYISYLGMLEEEGKYR
ncbi:MAG: ribosome small subunit-dependent GTPase A [Bacteroidales bacterium]|nr:ribosome small subunit-dependent GTPase A [Bacteroidales bacterium]